MRDPLPALPDDGLLTPEIGAWGERKYRLVSLYASMFATSMKRRWDQRVYIDLFAGCGRARIEGTSRILPASPLLALTLPDRFDRYIFCEADTAKLDVLRRRAAVVAPEANVSYVSGDVNASADAILAAIPAHGPRMKVLSFCFVDPYRLGNLRFDTLRVLAARFVDFLVLIPSFMDANRNPAAYTAPSNRRLDDYLGTVDWRAEWEVQANRGIPFGAFVADRFGRRMAAEKYRYAGLQDMVEVRSDDRNLPLYHLAFFSRHPLGQKFWKEAMKRSTEQLDMFADQG